MATYTVLDISKYNTITDYASIPDTVRGVIIRAGFRGYGSSGTLNTDSKFSDHYNSLKRKTKIGVYFLSQAITEAEAIEEADYVNNLILGKTIDFPVYIYSDWSNSAHDGRADGLSKENRTSIVIAFCERLKELNCRAGVYASESWFNNNLNWNKLNDKGYSLWVSKYSTEPPSVVTTYDGWQYTKTGTCSGVSGDVNLTTFYNDVAGWDTPTPTPGPDEPTGTVDINTLTLEVPTTSFVYTGEAIDCSFGLKLGESYLTPSTDYDCDYINNIDVGTATCTINGKGNYTGTRSFTYTITQVNIEDFILSFKYESIYDGNEHYAYDLKLYSEDYGYLVYDTDFQIGEYEGDVVNVGTVSFYVKGTGNFTGNNYGTYRINPATIEDEEFSLDKDEWKYTGEEIKPEVICDKYTLGTEYEVSYSNNINVGTGTCTVTGIGNYTGTVNMQFVISNFDITEFSFTLSQYTMIYDSSISSYEPEVIVDVLEKDVDYEVTYINNKGPGSAKCIINGINRYSGTVELEFIIIQKSLATCTIKLSKYTYGYTGEAFYPEVTITESSSEVLVVNKDYKLSWFNNINPGTATVVAVGINNYSGQLTENFTITGKDISECYAIFGRTSPYTEYLVDTGVFTLFVDEEQSVALTENVDYNIISIQKVFNTDHYDITYRVKGIGWCYNEVMYNFKAITPEQEEELKPPPPPDPPVPPIPTVDDDTEIWSYEGDFDQGEYVRYGDQIVLEIDPDSVAVEDYDYNIAAGDSSGGYEPTPGEGYPAGTEFDLYEIPIYSTFSIGKAFDVRSGIYYVYNSSVMNNRIRMCKLESDVEVPVKSMGWCSMTDLANLERIAVGNLVSTNGKVYIDKVSRERYINMENEHMYVRTIDNDIEDCPYGLSFEINSAVVGYVSPDSIVKLH